MAVIYYPQDAAIYRRFIPSARLVEMSIDVLPNTVFFFTGSSLFTASLVPQLLWTGSTFDITSSWALTASYLPQVGRSIVVCSAYTPPITGPDTAEVMIPFDPRDGSSSINWDVRRLSMRSPTYETTTSSINIEKSTGTGLFSASLVGTIILESGSYENSTTGSLGTVASGDKIRFNVVQIGTSYDWTIITEISNNSPNY